MFQNWDEDKHICYLNDHFINQRVFPIINFKNRKTLSALWLTSFQTYLPKRDLRLSNKQQILSNRVESYLLYVYIYISFYVNSKLQTIPLWPFKSILEWVSGLSQHPTVLQSQCQGCRHWFSCDFWILFSHFLLFHIFY